MSAQLTSNVFGTPEFGIVHIDPEQTANALQQYLDTASKLTGVSLDDINRNIICAIPPTAQITLAFLIRNGMKLFDAIVWLSEGKPDSHPLIVDTTMVQDNIPSMHDIARSVFYCYFMLIVQARYPASQNSTEKPRIPNFLTTIMGMDHDQSAYVERICSFEPQKFDPGWARFVSFRNFGREVLSRFGLGVAGYRMFGPFGLYRPKDDIPQELRSAYDFARRVANSDPTWDIHPLTRNPEILNRRGNLNKNLGNLILDVFTDEDIDEMVTSKVIYARPEREPTHINYKTWAPEDDISGTTRVFPGATGAVQ